MPLYAMFSAYMPLDIFFIDIIVIAEARIAIIFTYAYLRHDAPAFATTIRLMMSAYASLLMSRAADMPIYR